MVWALQLGEKTDVHRHESFSCEERCRRCFRESVAKPRFVSRQQMPRCNTSSSYGSTCPATGASRGLGRAMAEVLPDVGGTAILNGRDANTLKIAAEEMRDRGLKAETGVRHQPRHRRGGG